MAQQVVHTTKSKNAPAVSCGEWLNDVACYNLTERHYHDFHTLPGTRRRAYVDWKSYFADELID